MEDGNLFGSGLGRVSAGWKLCNSGIHAELLIFTVECFNSD